MVEAPASVVEYVFGVEPGLYEGHRRHRLPRPEGDARDTARATGRHDTRPGQQDVLVFDQMLAHRRLTGHYTN